MGIIRQLGMRKPEGRETFLMLAAESDVVITNFRVSTLEKWGLDWSALPPPPPTNYERKYQAEGRPFWRFLLVKRKT